MSSHPMVDFTLSRVNQEALLEKGRRMHNLRLARGGSEIVVTRRASIIRRGALCARSVMLRLGGESNDQIHVNSLDLHYPNRLQ